MKKILQVLTLSAVLPVAAAPVFELARDGAPRAAIVIPDKPTGVDRFASEELKYHLDKMFGVSFAVVAEKDADARTEPFRIFIGATASARKLGLLDRPFGEEEHVVKTAAKGLFLLGDDNAMPYGDVGNIGKCRRCGTLYAVYDFLENELGVRWIWPGELGEVIPRRRTFAVNAINRRRSEPLVSRRISGAEDAGHSSYGFSSPEARRRFYDAQTRLLLRHRYGFRRRIASGHSFGNWWKRFGKEHPEYFNLLSTGERKPLYGNSHLVTMCVSEPGVWKQKVADWKASLAGRKPGGRDDSYDWINCCENDYAGLCTCAKCRSWDAPDPRFALNDYWNGTADEKYLAALYEKEKNYGLDRVCGDTRWVLPKIDPARRYAAPLSDRYARFYNAVLAEARKTHPDARVVGYAYDNYVEAPKATRVDPGVIVEFVTRSYFPYDKTESDWFRKHWTGWRKAGAKDLMLFGNFMLAGGNFPIGNGRRIVDDFAFAYDNGMIGCMFCSMRGSWSCHLMRDYALIRAFRDPLRGYEKARADVLSAFGPAAAAVARYFDRVEAFSDSWTEETVRKAALKNITGGRTPGGSFPNTTAIIGDFYDDGFFPEMQAILAEAVDAAGGDKTVVARIAYLGKGLRDAELTREVRLAQKRYEAAKSEALRKAWYDALRRLVAFRKQVEGDFICAFDRAANDETTIGWPYDRLAEERVAR